MAEAGWNQTGADWQLMLSLGEGVGLAAPAGPIVASAASIPYRWAPRGEAFGWIGMVLVAESWRRRGAARWLMRDRIDALRGAGRAAMLDATAAGQPLYDAMGFAAGPGLIRFEGHAICTPPHPGVRHLREADMPAVAALDRAVFGADRLALLAALAGRLPGAAFGVFQAGALAGHAFARRGRVATQLGPIVARDPGVAAALLTAQASVLDGALLVDAPHASDMPALLAALGFTERRRFARMGLGIVPAIDGRVFAVAGPELG